MGGVSMKRFDMVIPMKSLREFRVVEAYETATPGLFVHRDIKDRYRWAVTHWSGVLVGAYEWKSRDEAIAFAAELADVCEWHRPLDRVQEVWLTDPEVKQAVETARIRVAGQISAPSVPETANAEPLAPLAPPEPSHEVSP